VGDPKPQGVAEPEEGVPGPLASQNWIGILTELRYAKIGTAGNPA